MEEVIVLLEWRQFQIQMVRLNQEPFILLLQSIWLTTVLKIRIQCLQKQVHLNFEWHVLCSSSLISDTIFLDLSSTVQPIMKGFSRVFTSAFHQRTLIYVLALLYLCQKPYWLHPFSCCKTKLNLWGKQKLFGVTWLFTLSINRRNKYVWQYLSAS